MKSVFVTITFLFTCCITVSIAGYQGNDKGWISPPEADKVNNPFTGNATSTIEGKKLYSQICIVCHGEKGKGDGIAGIALSPRPANFSSQKVQIQSDGAIFWKITEGRPPMAGYKSILTEAQRWQLVNYLRTFNNLKK